MKYGTTSSVWTTWSRACASRRVRCRDGAPTRNSRQRPRRAPRNFDGPAVLAACLRRLARFFSFLRLLLLLLLLPPYASLALAAQSPSRGAALATRHGAARAHARCDFARVRSGGDFGGVAAARRGVSRRARLLRQNAPATGDNVLDAARRLDEGAFNLVHGIIQKRSQAEAAQRLYTWALPQDRGRRRTHHAQTEERQEPSTSWGRDGGRPRRNRAARPRRAPAAAAGA